MFLRRGPRHFMISIHAPREGGDKGHTADHQKQLISIPAPREGGDRIITFPFLLALAISIHAPREGGDSKDAQFYL